MEFLTPIMPSLPGEPYQYQIRVTASQPGYLNAWIDFDGLGFGALDHITPDGLATPDNIPLVQGDNFLTFTAPESTTPFATTLYSRFRFTEESGDGGTTPDGLARSGEVEDYALGSLGNLVWFDDGNATSGTLNNGIYDAGEVVVPNVTLELRDGSGNPVLDGVGNPIATETDINGNYLFTGLSEGDYTVYIPADEFGLGGDLEDRYSSSGNGTPDDDFDHDVDENGLDNDFPYLNGIASGVMNLSLGAEPSTEIDDATGDANSNLTLDFGFIRVDFGDLPSQYPTEMVNNAARHIIDNVTFLGALVDAESDGAPTTSALGDDTIDAIDDEDGVLFLTPIMPGESYTIAVLSSVNDTYLNAWIDFNNDGDFDDTGEQITSDEPLNAGLNTLNLTAPASTGPFGSTLYSRFRLSDNAGEVTTPDGEAPNGEIEDYALLSLGDLIWLDDGSDGGIAGDGRQNGDEPPISGVRVELYLAGQIPGAVAPLAFTTTDDDGRYYFTGLNPGDYVVHIPASQFAAGRPLASLVSSFGNGEPNADRDETSDENGIDSPNPALSGISSGIVTLAFGTEPTSEDGDANSNLTIDFGFHGLVSLGNRVWFDPDNNGLHDEDEIGISGVELRLYTMNGNLALNYHKEPMITTTDEDGYYLFDELIPGYYIIVIHDENFAEGASLDGFQNSDPTQEDANFNFDTADHGLTENLIDITPDGNLEGTLSSEDRLDMDATLQILKQGRFSFEESIPSDLEVPEYVPPESIPTKTSAP